MAEMFMGDAEKLRKAIANRNLPMEYKFNTIGTPRIQVESERLIRRVTKEYRYPKEWKGSPYTMPLDAP
jgi:hypothetical protein